MNKKTLYLVQGAVIAALYVVLTYGQELLLPNSTFMAVQFRLSELLVVLALFTPAAIPGLTIGCALANLVAMQAMPLDVVLGSFATLLATVCIYKLRNVRLFNLPFLALLMPAVFNGIIIGTELLYVTNTYTLANFLIQGGLVALGEFVVCFVLGLPFTAFLQRTKVVNKMISPNAL